MICAEARDQLSAYLDDVLLERDRRVLVEHMSGCAHCQRELERLRQAVDLLRALDRPHAPPGFVERVMAATAPWYRRLLHALFAPISVKLPLELAAVVMVGVLGVQLMRETPIVQLPSGRDLLAREGTSLRAEPGGELAETTPAPPEGALPESDEARLGPDRLRGAAEQGTGGRPSGRETARERPIGDPQDPDEQRDVAAIRRVEPRPSSPSPEPPRPVTPANPRDLELDARGREMAPTSDPTRPRPGGAAPQRDEPAASPSGSDWARREEVAKAGVGQTVAPHAQRADAEAPERGDILRETPSSRAGGAEGVPPRPESRAQSPEPCCVSATLVTANTSDGIRQLAERVIALGGRVTVLDERAYDPLLRKERRRPERQVVVIEVSIPRESYAKLVIELRKLGRWTISHASRAFPADVRLRISVSAAEPPDRWGATE